MFLEEAGGRNSSVIPRAALCGLNPDNEEILLLLLGVLDWQCTAMPALTPEAAKGAQLVFVGREQSVMGWEAKAFAPDAIFILITEGDATDNQEVGLSAFAGALSSPIDLQSAELIVNNAAAEFISRNAH
ncbi:hypothetical protein [Sandarakinorhabdus rubra]|uniref:hypothetical protein n=1 Tax=Sandarakinorhabdus rubra TaxID=2672568 RepID=UPI0013D91A0E|nr:hypothetical protein [Sandarakinorhabdus rubra]